MEATKEAIPEKVAQEFEERILETCSASHCFMRDCDSVDSGGMLIMSEHTAIPWNCAGSASRTTILDKDYEPIAFCMSGEGHDTDAANAEFIIKAVNHHGEILELLKRIEHITIDVSECRVPKNTALAEIGITAAALLAKIEGGSPK